jgi:hypothetical protein
MAISGVAPAIAPAALEREVKYALGPGRGPFARQLLDALCRPDPAYPAAVVSTIYYDTPGLELLGRKLDSDYLKTKVRLRWYGDLEGHAAGERSFLEVKSRIGSVRTKERVETPLAASRLSRMPLDDPALVEVLALLAPIGLELPAGLRPALLIQYHRYRYIDPLSQSRISLDTDILAPRADPRLLRHEYPVVLPAAILEVKGESEELPRGLRPLLHLGARRLAFSKYGFASLAMLRSL